MEFLNNIWMAISTPNEILINILLIPASFIENYLIMLLFSSILKISISKKQQLLYVFIMSLSGLLITFSFDNPYNLFINYITSIILSYIILKITLLKSIFAIVISALIFNLVGALILNPYLTICNITTLEISSIVIHRIPYVLIMYIFISIIIFILRFKKIRLAIIDDIDKKNKYIISSNLILGIITISIHTIITLYYVDILPLNITFLSFLSLLLYFAISIYSITRIFKLNLATRKLESAESYNNTLHILHDNVRGFKHDFDNIVTTIGGYIRTNDIEGLKKYYVELEDDCQRVNNLYILNPDIVNNDGIYNLLTKKYYEADSKDIKVNITFLLDLSTLKMKIYEFARILGILLDNAIEASVECNEKIINLTFRNDSKNNRQLIIVENTYKNKDLDIEKIFEKGVSEKENHTGLGLWEVRNLVKKNHNTNLYTSKTDKFFSQQLEIY